MGDSLIILTLWQSWRKKDVVNQGQNIMVMAQERGRGAHREKTL